MPMKERPSRLARLIVQHPVLVIGLSLALTLVGGVLAATKLAFQTDRSALIGPQHAYNQAFGRLRAEFGDMDAMVALLRAPTRAEARAAADALAQRLAQDPGLSVFHRVPPAAFHGRGLLFLEAKTLQGILGRLRAGSRPLAALRREGLGGFYREAGALVGELARSAGPDGAGADGLDPRDLAFLPAFAADLEDALQGHPSYDPPWTAWVPADALAGRDGSTWTSDGRLVVLVRDRAEGRDPAAAVAVLRAAAAALHAERPGVEVELTGEPVLEADEYATYRADARRATLASLLGISLLVLLAMRRWLGPLLCMVSVSSAVAVTLGLAALWPGHLNLISLAIGALMLGLGVDYAIHWISRYDEERGRGLTGERAVAAALAATGRAIAAGSVTTALAFLATLFTEVEGIRELGLVAGAGILLSLLANLVLLPTLVVLSDRGAGGRPRRPHSRWPRSRLALGVDRLFERRPVLVIAGCVAAVAAALGFGIGAHRLRYDPDLLALQAQDLPSVRLANELLHDPAVSGMFAAAVVDDLEALAELEVRLRALESVGSTASALDALPREQPRKLEVLAALRAAVDALPARNPAPASPAAVAAGLRGLAAGLEVAGSAALQAGRPADAEAVVALQERSERLAKRLSEDPAAAGRLEAYTAHLRAQLDEALGRLLEECARAPITLADLPVEQRERLVGRNGKLLLRIYPRQSVWQEEPLRRFVTEVQGVVPDAAGFPIQFFESDRLLRSGYLRATRIALIFVVVYLLVHFRSPLATGVATLTLLAGAAWGAGLLALLDLPLNPASLLALPLICGIGIDYSIHVIHRDREARRGPTLAGAPALLATSSGRAVWLSSLTTIVGFGALTLSHHRGLASIGWTVSAGVAGCLLASALVCPALLRLSAGPGRAPRLGGLPGPKTGPGGTYRRPEPESGDGDGEA
ncbi:MAG: MMPL family transporter [Planctomycetota bacterium]